MACPTPDLVGDPLELGPSPFQLVVRVRAHSRRAEGERGEGQSERDPTSCGTAAGPAGMSEAVRGSPSEQGRPILHGVVRLAELAVREIFRATPRGMPSHASLSTRTPAQPPRQAVALGGLGRAERPSCAGA